MSEEGVLFCFDPETQSWVLVHESDVVTEKERPQEEITDEKIDFLRSQTGYSREEALEVLENCHGILLHVLTEESVKHAISNYEHILKANPIEQELSLSREVVITALQNQNHNVAMAIIQLI